MRHNLQLFKRREFGTIKDRKVLDIADQLDYNWKFSWVTGALDGKHMRIECQKPSGSLYRNLFRKTFFPDLFMAM